MLSDEISSDQLYFYIWLIGMTGLFVAIIMHERSFFTAGLLAGSSSAFFVYGLCGVLGVFTV